MSITIALLTYEQREEVAEAAKSFTCRSERHKDDPTVDFGDRYIRDGIWADLDERGVTRTWGAVVEDVFGGYVALASDAVHLSRGERQEAELETVQLSKYGCIQIVMLAVRAELQERKDVHVGTALVDHAILVAREAGKQIGARFLAADVNPPAEGFYERCGFVPLLGEADVLKKKRESGMIPMVLDLHPRG